MSQTNTNTNNGLGNTIQNQIFRRGGRTTAVEAAAVAVMIAETTQSLNVHLKEK